MAIFVFEATITVTVSASDSATAQDIAHDLLLDVQKVEEREEIPGDGAAWINGGHAHLVRTVVPTGPIPSSEEKDVRDRLMDEDPDDSDFPSGYIAVGTDRIIWGVSPDNNKTAEAALKEAQENVDNWNDAKAREGAKTNMVPLDFDIHRSSIKLEMAVEKVGGEHVPWTLRDGIAWLAPTIDGQCSTARESIQLAARSDK